MLQTDLTMKDINALIARQSLDKADKDKTVQSFELVRFHSVVYG